MLLPGVRFEHELEDLDNWICRFLFAHKGERERREIALLKYLSLEKALEPHLQSGERESWPAAHAVGVVADMQTPRQAQSSLPLLTPLVALQNSTENLFDHLAGSAFELPFPLLPGLTKKQDVYRLRDEVMSSRISFHLSADINEGLADELVFAPQSQEQMTTLNSADGFLLGIEKRVRFGPGGLLPIVWGGEGLMPFPPCKDRAWVHGGSEAVIIPEAGP